MRKCAFTMGAMIILVAHAFCQTDTTCPSVSGSFDITLANSGISFGDGQRMNGIRFTWRDGDFESVNGINISIWKPRDKPTGVVNGVSFGLVGPGARQMNGLTVGLGGALASESMTGINIGGLGLVSQGSMTGINIAGLGVVAQKNMIGINLSGLGTVSQGSMLGVNFGGLGVVSQKGIEGLNVAGLGLVSSGSVHGISIAGLGMVTQGEAQGVAVAGLGLVGQGGITGVSIAGGGVVAKGTIAGISGTLGILKASKEIAGVSIGGYKLDAPLISGINLGICWTESTELTGLTCAAYNQTDGIQRGLVIGIVNCTEDLLGIQIGLLNIVKDNPAGLKVLPFLNARF